MADEYHHDSPVKALAYVYDCIQNNGVMVTVGDNFTNRIEKLLKGPTAEAGE